MGVSDAHRFTLSRLDRTVAQTRKAVAVSRDLMCLARTNITATAARLEHARNVLQTVWLHRELSRRRLRS